MNEIDGVISIALVHIACNKEGNDNIADVVDAVSIEVPIAEAFIKTLCCCCSGIAKDLFLLLFKGMYYWNWCK
jgi:hypothetical protein